MVAKGHLEANNWEVDQAVAAIHADPNIKVIRKPAGYRALIRVQPQQETPQRRHLVLPDGLLWPIPGVP